ncbi:MAG: cbb3-type cytochrome oxidase assembly protein CcoS [Gammaproteobacteria bacterium]
MESLYFLIPIAVIFVGIAAGIFFWALKSGQFEDLEGPAWRMLQDENDRIDASDPAVTAEAKDKNAAQGSPPRGE